MNFKTLKESSKPFELVTGTAENTVSLTWKAVAHADGYRVFSSEHGKNYFVGILNTNNTTAKIKNCENGVPIDFKVKAFRIADGPDNFFSESKVVSVCPMVTPQKLVANEDNGVITLCWMDKSGCDGYKIYVDATGDEKYTFLRYSPSCICRLENLNMSGVLRFRIRSFKMINHIEKISNFSNIAEIEVAKNTVVAKELPRIIDRTALPELVENRRFAIKENSLRNDNHSCVIMLGGDVTTCKAVQDDAVVKGNSFDFTLSSLKGTLSSSDFSVAALDTDLNDNNLYTYENPNTLNCPSALLDTLCKGGLDALALSGKLARKIPSAFHSYPISAITSAKGELGRDSFRVVLINNIRVAFISTDNDSNINQLVHTAKNHNSDFIIVYYNWKDKHSPVVKPAWRKTAMKIASAGADFIVGCGVNALCEYDVLTASDGRNVPVAYSLGCIIGCESLTRFEDLGALICLRLKRKAATGKVTADFVGYIPFAYKNGDILKRAVILTENNFSYFGKSDYERLRKDIKTTLGDKISYARYEKPEKSISFSLNGSSVISDLFEGYDNVHTDRSYLFNSQLTMATDRMELDEKYYRDGVVTLHRNLVKGYREYLSQNKQDFLILDFYYTATTPVYELDGVLYSGGNTFKNSLFYKDNKSKLKELQISSSDVWKPLMDRYIEIITSAYKKSEIILVRIDDPKLYYANGSFTRSHDNNLDKELLKSMEEYFIRKINPFVIALSRYYPGIVSKNGSCYCINRDRRFVKNVSDVAVMAANGSLKAGTSALRCDCDLWLSCVADYFDAIKKYSCDKFFFTDTPADYIISRLSSDFISANFNDIKALKESNIFSFDEIVNSYDFGSNSSLKKVCIAINAIRKGKLDNPSIGEVIRLNLFAKHDLAQQLSEFFNKRGIIPDCIVPLKDTEFYLKCALMMIQGTNISAVTLLVSEYYKKNKPMIIDSVGGAGLSAILDKCENIAVGAVFSDCNILTAFEPPVEADYSYIDSNTIFYRELARKQLQQSGKQAGDWVIVDFNEIIRPLYKSENEIFSHVPGCDRSRIFRSFFKNFKKVNPYEKGAVRKDYIKKCVKKFADYLKQRYRDNIILCRFSLNANYLDFSGIIRPFADEAIDDKNKLIAYVENEFIKLTECFEINYADKFISEQSGVRNHVSTAIYENLFYNYCADALEKIITKNCDSKLFDKVDILSYIERAERILRANPNIPYELQKQLFGDMTQLVAVQSYNAE